LETRSVVDVERVTAADYAAHERQQVAAEAGAAGDAGVYAEAVGGQRVAAQHAAFGVQLHVQLRVRKRVTPPALLAGAAG